MIKRFYLALLLAVCCVCGWAEYSVPMMEALSGAKSVYASVEGLKVLFTFDTGCSSLLLNQNIFNELVRMGAVRREDLSAESEAELANGESHLVRNFTIPRLKIGGCVLHNVRASVGVYDRPDADPLLGQAVLERFRSYTISNGRLSFDAKPEGEQQALALASSLRSDTTRNGNRQIVNALKPYKDRLSPRYLLLLAKACDYTDDFRQSIALYDVLLSSDSFIDEDHTVYDRRITAKMNLADMLYADESSVECELALFALIKEAKQEPVSHEALRYSYSTLCYLYWKVKNYEKAEWATMQYADYLLAPNTHEWLEEHAMTPNEDLAKLLNHLSKYHSYQGHATKAERYKRMSIHAGWKE